MKIKVTFKDPDGVYESIDEAVRDSLKALTNLNDDEREVLEEKRREQVSDKLTTWIEYGEYLDVEFDTETGTATVLKRGK